MGKISEALERLRRRLQELVDEVGEVLAPEPELVPVPVRRPQDPREPRRR